MGGGVSGSRKIRTSPFELRVRLLLVLLAMVLAAANVGNFLLLRSAREALRSGEGRLASEVSRRVLREAGESSLASSLTRLDAVAVRYPPTTLRSLAARQGLLGLELISPEGTVLSSSSPERLGAIDSDLASAGGGPAGAHVESERWLGPVEREGESAIVDYRTLRTDKGAVAPAKCPNCQNDVMFRYIVSRRMFSLFFIPLIPFSPKHFVLCPVCTRGIEVTGRQVTSNGTAP